MIGFQESYQPYTAKYNLKEKKKMIEKKNDVKNKIREKKNY